MSLTQARFLHIAALLTVLALWPSAAGAGSLNDLIPELVGRLLPQSTERDATVNILQRSTQGQLGSTVVPSPASGFTFEFDPALGTFKRTTESFGPVFSQRAETLGKGMVSFGLFYVRFDAKEFDGKDVDNGELQFSSVTIPGLITKIFVDATTDLISLSTLYGLLDNVDVGIAVPIIHQDVKLKGIATLGSTVISSASVSRETIGVGDILLRSKYNFYRTRPLSLAAALDISLPTGEREEFTGSGTTQFRPIFIASGSVGFGLAPHVNVGFSLGDRSRVENEFVYAVGFDWGILKWLTFDFDILGRHIIDNRRPLPVQEPGAGFVPGVPVKIAGSDIVDASIGLKVNPWKKVLLVGNILLPITKTGFRSHGIPIVGIEVPF